MKKGILVLAVAVLTLLTGTGWIAFSRAPEEIVLNQQDLDRISQESYNGIFVSMFSTEEYKEEDFAIFQGLDTLIVGDRAESSAQVTAYLDHALATDNTITNIYLGIDPAKIWDLCGQKAKKWNQEMEQVFQPYFSENSQITFEIMLPYPKLDYWVEMETDDRQVLQAVYRNFAERLEVYSNVTVFFLGAEEWLISNPASYVKEGVLNSVVAQKLMLFTFCDGDYRIYSRNAEAYFEKLNGLVTKELENPAVYPDYSEWKMIFWGDSVIGNYESSFSTPGVVSGLTGAETYNYAIGGTQATDMEGYHVSFPDMVEGLKGASLGISRDGTQFPYEVLTNQDTKLCIAVHFGLNDYFNGIRVENTENPFDTSTFTGALRTGVKNLKEAYPNAVILLMTPPYCDIFSGGTEVNSQVGSVLTDYVAAVEKVAGEYGILCMNNYVGLGISEDNAEQYLEDGVHLNEQGRYELGQHMIEALEQWINKK